MGRVVVAACAGPKGRDNSLPSEVALGNAASGPWKSLKLAPNAPARTRLIYKGAGRSHSLSVSARLLPSLRWLSIPLACVCFSTSEAVIFDSTADPGFNTTAPGGSLSGSGWQFQGQWGGFLATPIAPQYFISAEHIGGTIGQQFILNSIAYTTVAVFDDPNSDLRIWKISGTFPSNEIAPLSTAPNEIGKDLVVFGRGLQRGAPVLDGGNFLHGWLFGAGDSVQRWGTNTASSTIDGGLGIGQLLGAEFNHGLNSTECDLSAGDSAGAVFLQDPADNVWKLAGINYAIDGSYKTSPSDPNLFDADLFDQNGFYFSDNSPATGPGSFYASRIASNLPFIRNAIGVPQPIAAVSRKIHGAAGTFDLNLPTTGMPALECRSGGGSGVYQVIMNFAGNVTVSGASVTAGVGTVSGFSVNGAAVTVNLTGIANAQWLVITLSGVTEGTQTGDTSIAMGVLLGDTTGDGSVNSADIGQTKSQSGQIVTAANFRQDVTADGSINSADISFVKAKSGTALARVTQAPGN